MSSSYEYIIVDLKEIVEEYDCLPQFECVYRKFPIEDIIETILGVKTELNYFDVIFYELEIRLPEVIDKIDMEVMEIFFDDLVQIVDTKLAKASQGDTIKYDYVFYRWLDKYTVVLKSAGEL